MKIHIPPFAAAVIGKLCADGYEAYAVGGCVRDTMLGRAPNDWDVTTSALPETTLSLFSCADGFKAVPTGIAHGTVTVISGGEPVEVTTFRVDGKYSDHRRPDSVGFTGRLEEDLARRDFTINAMAYSPERGLIDPYGGERDLGDRIIRCVGEPERRFDEDALRILRALRFASTLGFEIDARTAEADVGLRALILDISRERVSAELEKLLLGQDAEKILRTYEPVFLTTIPELADEDFRLAAECAGKTECVRRFRSVARGTVLRAERKDAWRRACRAETAEKGLVKDSSRGAERSRASRRQDRRQKARRAARRGSYTGYYNSWNRARNGISGALVRTRRYPDFR